MSNSRWRWLVALLAVISIVGAACGGDDETSGGDPSGDVEAEEFPEGSTMAAIQEKGEIVIGVKFDVPLFGFKNPTSGEVEGFDTDLGKYVAAKLGVEPKFVEAISDNRIPFLQDGTVDLIMSTMTITTDRDAEIDYSRPYFIAHGDIMVPEDSDIAGIDDLAGKKVCTALGSTYEGTIKEQAPEADLKLVDSYSECFTLLQNGQVDALSTDNVILTGFAQQDDSFKLLQADLTTEPYGIGIPDGQTDMKEFLDETLEEMFENGDWQAIYDKWIGDVTGIEADQPSEYTLEDALKLFPCVETC